MIIGITGKARSGKDTVAEHLAFKLHRHTYSFAEPVKQAVMAIFSLAKGQVYGFHGYDREQVEKPFGISVRQMLQKVGQDARKNYGEDIWIHAAEKKAKPFMEEGFIMTDVRQDNEAQWIRSIGGIIIEITREGLEPVGYKGDVTEAGIPEYLINYTIENNGTIAELRGRALKTVKAHGKWADFKSKLNWTIYGHCS